MVFSVIIDAIVSWEENTWQKQAEVYHQINVKVAGRSFLQDGSSFSRVSPARNASAFNAKLQPKALKGRTGGRQIVLAL
jgi:hypothetical protein